MSDAMRTKMISNQINKRGTSSLILLSNREKQIKKYGLKTGLNTTTFKPIIAIEMS